jgi:hypothetical protein
MKKPKPQVAVPRHDRDGYIRCRVCDCTDREPCCPPCGWAQVDLCTTCYETLTVLLVWTQSAHRPNVSALWREIKRAKGTL